MRSIFIILIYCFYRQDRVKNILGTRLLFGGLPTIPLEQIISIPTEHGSKIKKVTPGESLFSSKRTEPRSVPKKEEILEKKLAELNSMLGCRMFKDIQNDVAVKAILYQKSPYKMTNSTLTENLQSPYQIIDEKYLISHIFIILLGYETSLFEWDCELQLYKLTNRKIQLQDTSNSCILSVIDEIMGFASILHFVRDKINEFKDCDNIQSQVIEGFITALGNEFEEINKYFIELHEIFLYQHSFIHCSQLLVSQTQEIWKPITMQFLLEISRQQISELLEYRKILELIILNENSSPSVKVCEILDQLFELSLKTSIHYESHILGNNNRIWKILLGALEPYIRILAEWITKGKLNEDKYGEFFIKTNTEQKPNELMDGFKQWKNMYILQMNGNNIALPYTLGQEAEYVIRYGKTVKVLEFWKSKNPSVEANFKLKSDLANEIMTKLREYAETRQKIKLPKPNFDISRVSDCLKNAKTKGINQTLETCTDYECLNNGLEIIEELKKASEISSNTKISKLEKLKASNIDSFTNKLNSAPYQFKEYELTGTFTLQQQISLYEADTSADEHEKIEPNMILSPIKPHPDVENLKILNKNTSKYTELLDEYQKNHSNTSFNKLFKEIYENSVMKYDCSPFFEYYDQLEKYDMDAYKNPAISGKSIVEESIWKPLNNVYQNIGDLFSKYINGELKLKSHLDAWTNAFLMMDGHSMQSFISFIFDKLNTDMKSGIEIFDNLYELNNALREFSGSKPNFKDLSNNFTFILSPNAKKSLKNPMTDPNYFEQLSLKYLCEFPINIILCEECENKYNTLFQWILKIKRSNLAIQNLKKWKKISMNLKGPILKIIHQFELFEREVGHFTRVLENFVFTRAIVPNIGNLQKEMLNAKDFDSLVVSHMRILQKMLDNSLCSVFFRSINLIH